MVKILHISYRAFTYQELSIRGKFKPDDIRFLSLTYNHPHDYRGYQPSCILIDNTCRSILSPFDSQIFETIKQYVAVYDTVVIDLSISNITSGVCFNQDTYDILTKIGESYALYKEVALIYSDFEKNKAVLLTSPNKVIREYAKNRSLKHAV
jgi:hypothetical protein